MGSYCDQFAEIDDAYFAHSVRSGLESAIASRQRLRKAYPLAWTNSNEQPYWRRGIGGLADRKIGLADRQRRSQDSRSSSRIVCGREGQ